jgi:hypothetical protein
MKLALTFFITLGVLSATPTTVSLVDPSTLAVNGTYETVLRIDVNDIARLNSPWQANLSSVGGNISHTYYPKDAKIYKEEAYLYTQITEPGLSSEQSTALQDAAWYLTDNSFNLGLELFLKSGFRWGLDKSTLEIFEDVATDLKNAAGAIKTMDFSGFTIVSDANSGWSYRNPEYIYCDSTSTPEPATNALLGAALAVSGVARFLLRKKQSVKS